MKVLRVYIIISFLDVLIGIFVSLFLLSDNLDSPVNKKVNYPFNSFSLYQLLPNGEVQVNFINIAILAILFAIPITLIVTLVSRMVRLHFNKRGRI